MLWRRAETRKAESRLWIANVGHAARIQPCRQDGQGRAAVRAYSYSLAFRFLGLVHRKGGNRVGQEVETRYGIQKLFIVAIECIQR